MKKLIFVLWVVFCLGIILIPKAIDRFTPKTIYKEIVIYRVKEVIKEKIVYTPLENSIFRITRISDKPHEAYKVEFIQEFEGGCKIWGGKDRGKDFYLSVEYEKGVSHQHPIPELRGTNAEPVYREDKKEEPLPEEYKEFYMPDSQTSVTATSVGYIYR